MRNLTTMLFTAATLMTLATGCAKTAGADPGAGGNTTDDGGGYGSFPGDDASPEEDAPTVFDPTAADDASAFEDGDAYDASLPPPGPPFDAGPDGLCTQPLAAGDLVIDELMISSVAGAGDYGEWLEVQSTLGCAVDLIGLHGECPSGAKVHTFDITTDLWIEANGTFVVADSSNPALNHELPGTLVTWLGEPGDVLRNKGGTVTLMLDGGIIDSVTFPSLKLVTGTSVAFPSNCPATARSDWTNWQMSTSSWFPGFFGTPNAPNNDIQCP
jgi:hypothetical protein